MKTISITEEADERLMHLKDDETTSFSEVIVKYYPARRKLSNVLEELGDCSSLADTIGKVSREMQKNENAKRQVLTRLVAATLFLVDPMR